MEDDDGLWGCQSEEEEVLIRDLPQVLVVVVVWGRTARDMGGHQRYQNDTLD